MKMQLFRFAFLLVCLTLPLTTTAQVVDIPDGNLALSIASALNQLFPLDETALTVADMERLTALQQPVTSSIPYGEGISDLTGLEFATNLTHLHLNRFSISDVSPLSGLTNLVSLNLEGNSISDVSPLSGLTNLEWVLLAGNSISDISLSGLTNLEWVLLAGNSISNISLSRLTNLRELHLRNNSISDIYSLSGLTNLESLDLRNNSISDIYSLSGLTNLELLDLRNNSISDIYPLSGLTNLERLDLHNNSISDLSPLVKNAGLGKRNRPNRSDAVIVSQNPLSYLSIHTHSPALQSRGVFIIGDNQVHPALLKISGDNQKGMPLVALEKPFVVEAQDANGVVIAGISVTFTVTRGDGTLSVTSTTTNANGRARSTLKLGRYIGVNAVEVSADGIESKCLFHATISTLDRLLLVDVNGDGRVDILDLVSVASAFGSAGTDLAADVNGDGTVNLLDLVSVAGMLGQTAAAPSAHLQASEMLTAVEVRQWLTDAKSLEVRDPIMKKGIMMLEQLLVSLTPKETELLANYPNPFNPETWIPYRLAEDAFVTLTIYDGSGRLVRTLDVGHQVAAVYESRSKAIYWDGKNELGERVASGVYFYHLSAGDYSATRRMLVIK